MGNKYNKTVDMAHDRKIDNKALCRAVNSVRARDDPLRRPHKYDELINLAGRFCRRG